MNEQNNLNPTPPLENNTPISPQQPGMGVSEQQVLNTVNSVQPELNGQPQQVQQAVPVQPVVDSSGQQAQPMVDSSMQTVQQPVQQMPTQPIQDMGAVNASQGVQVEQQPVAQQYANPQVEPQVSQVVNNQVPVNQDIVNQGPINPIANNPATPSNGVYGPSIPVNATNDATNVGFVASSAPMPKKKNKFAIFAVVLVLLVGLGCLGYFVIYPYVKKAYFSNPRNVYEASIKEMFKGINSKAEELVHQKAIYDIEATFDSNMDMLSSYVGYSYGLNVGVDPTKQTIQTGLTIKNINDNTEYSYFKYLKDNKEYAKYSSYRGYIYLGEANLEETQEIFASFQEMFDYSEKLSSEDMQYITNKLSELLINSIDEEKLTTEDAVIKLNGEEVKVTNNKYTIDYDVKINTKKTIIEGFKNDDKALDILAKINETTKEELIEMIDETLENEDVSDEDKDLVVYFSIYTSGMKDDIVGFEMTSNENDSRYYYYFNDSFFEIKAINVTENIDTGKEEKDTLSITGTKKGETTEVVIQYNDDEIAKLDVRKWDETGFDFDYTINYESQEIKGSIKFTSDVNDERAKYSFVGDVNIGGETISLKIDIGIDWTSEVANINTDSADTLTEAELLEKQKEFSDALMKTPIGQLFSTVSNDYNEEIYNYYNESIDDYNYIEGNIDDYTEIPGVVN